MKSLFNSEGRHGFSFFTSTDRTIVKSALAKLPGNEYKAITLRFWNQNTIEEIAEAMRLTWDEADQVLNRALAKLKAACLANSAFSRSGSSTSSAKPESRYLRMALSDEERKAA